MHIRFWDPVFVIRRGGGHQAVEVSRDVGADILDIRVWVYEGLP